MSVRRKWGVGSFTYMTHCQPPVTRITTCQHSIIPTLCLVAHSVILRRDLVWPGPRQTRAYFTRFSLWLGDWWWGGQVNLSRTRAIVYGPSLPPFCSNFRSFEVLIFPSNRSLRGPDARWPSRSHWHWHRTPATPPCCTPRRPRLGSLHAPATPRQHLPPGPRVPGSKGAVHGPDLRPRGAPLAGARAPCSHWCGPHILPGGRGVAAPFCMLLYGAFQGGMPP